MLKGLQKLGKALMLPVAVLPAAALLLRLGADDVLNIPFVMQAGAAIFDNLALLFAVGIAVGVAFDGGGAAALAGAVGYFDRGGDMEMCIAIRTLMQSGRRISVQAGAGLVYDSKPAAEYHETVNKARALFTAVAQAESRDLDGKASLVKGAGPVRRAPRGRRAGA